MKSQTLNFLANQLGLEVKDATLDLALQSVPVVGGILGNIKIARLTRRVNLHEKKINDMAEKISINETNKINLMKDFFLFFVEQISDEDQEEKIEYILNGYDGILSEEEIESDKIYSYYDTLKTLRYQEIVYFVNEYSNGQKVGKFEKFEINKNSIRIENKLKTLGLIVAYTQNNSYGLSWNDIENPMMSNFTCITDYGVDFLMFFRMGK